MKSAVLIFLFMFSLLTHGISQKLSFTFDTAGNQVTRTWICIGCPVSRGGLKPNVLASQRQDSLMPVAPQISGQLLSIDHDPYNIYKYPQDGSLSVMVRFSLNNQNNHMISSGDSIIAYLGRPKLLKDGYLPHLTYGGRRKLIYGVWSNGD